MPLMVMATFSASSTLETSFTSMVFHVMFCFLSSSLRRSALCSASAFTASCTWISNTRWVPPFKSSPSRMLSEKFFLSSSPFLGNPMMPNTQISRVTTMITVRAVRLFFMGVLLACPNRVLLLLAFAGRRAESHTGHRAARHLNFEIVGFHPQHYCIAIQGHDGA